MSTLTQIAAHIAIAAGLALFLLYIFGRLPL